MAPATSIAEEEGKFLPFVAGTKTPLAFPGLSTSSLAEAAGAATRGGLVAGAIPTESGSLESNEENAKWGTALAGALSSLGLPAQVLNGHPTARRIFAHAINGAVGEAIGYFSGVGHVGASAALLRHGIGWELAKALPEMLAAAGKGTKKIPTGVVAKETVERKQGNEKSTKND